MQTGYYKEYSRFLKREMEFKVYGQGGQPCLAFACEGGRFYDWEDHGMVGSLAPFLEEGRLQLFCADSLDDESWLGQGDPRTRAEAQERWFCYLSEELIPRALALNAATGGHFHNVITLGASLGAGHAAALYLRRPGLVCGMVGLSGSYQTARWFGDYTDDLTLRSNPVQFVRLAAANRTAQPRPLLLCCGQGPYEEPFLADTQGFAAALREGNMPYTLELWGQDSAHDWPWWQKQLPIFVQNALNALPRD